MKKLKLSIVGLLTLVGLAATAGESQAYGLLRDRCNRYSTYICCRPYNAFTPVCFGSITCNGCAPVMMQPPCMPQCGGWMPGPYGHTGCGPMGCCPTYTTGDGCGPGLPYPMDPMAGMMPPMMPQGQMVQQYQPQPYAAPLPIQQQSHSYMPQMPMHNLGYQPGYQVPGYHVQPVSYYPQWPNQPVVPNYWYGR